MNGAVVVETPQPPVAMAMTDSGRPLVPPTIEEEGIEEVLWHQHYVVEVKAKDLEKLENQLHALCLDTCDAHKKVKKWAQDIKTSAGDLFKEVKRL